VSEKTRDPDGEEAAATRRELRDVYDQVQADIAATDETSFRLLAAVPVASTLVSGGLGVLGAPEEGSVVAAVMLAGVAAAGLLITLGFFRWEMRNIQKCDWLISRAARLEKALFPDAPKALHFQGMKPCNECVEELKKVEIPGLSLRGMDHWGKTEATKLIYTGALLVWVVPLLIGIGRLIEATSLR
jgi:hypothetical protein